MTALLSIDGVTVRLGDRKVLDTVSFQGARGEVIGLIGPNGAGKSTLLKAAAGLTPVEAGAISVSGAALSAMPLQDRARRIAYLPQARPVFWSIPARAVVALGRFAYGDPLSQSAEDKAAVNRALAGCNAEGLAQRPVNELSGGELARIHLARAFAGETPILLADEPVTALDLKHQITVMKLLCRKADEGGAVIAALHDLALAYKYCTRIIVINHGRIAADGPPEQTLTPALLRDVFGVTPEDAGLDRASFEKKSGSALSK